MDPTIIAGLGPAIRPFTISGALYLAISPVGKVITGSSFSPLSSFSAWRRPSAPGVA
jgi:hypothetical protein